MLAIFWYVYNSHISIICLSKLLTPLTSITLKDAITHRIHHRNLTILTAVKFFKIAAQTFGSLGLRSILRDSEILLFSVVADVLLFFHHHVHKADQTFSVLCKKHPKSSLL